MSSVMDHVAVDELSLAEVPHERLWRFSVEQYHELIGAGILAFFKMFLSQRDLNREVLRLLKGDNGDLGLVKTVDKIGRDMYDSGGIVARIRHSVVTMRVAIAARGIETRDEDQP